MSVKKLVLRVLWLPLLGLSQLSLAVPVLKLEFKQLPDQFIEGTQLDLPLYLVENRDAAESSRFSGYPATPPFALTGPFPLSSVGSDLSSLQSRFISFTPVPGFDSPSSRVSASDHLITFYVKSTAGIPVTVDNSGIVGRTEILVAVVRVEVGTPIPQDDGIGDPDPAMVFSVDLSDETALSHNASLYLGPSGSDNEGELFLGGITPSTYQILAAPPATDDAEFTVGVDASGVAAGRGLWNLTGPYFMAANGNPLFLDLLHDPAGRLTGTATYTVAPATTVTMPIKGSVNGVSGSTAMKVTLKGADPTRTVAVSLTLNLTVDTANRELRGRLTGSARTNATTTPVDDPVVLDIPEAMDGTWTLRVSLERSRGTAAGTAELTLSNLVKHTFVVRGKMDGSNTAALTLTGAPDDPAAKAIRIRTVVTPLDGGWSKIESLSGRGYGQAIGW